jgi:hypothetical protein
MIRRLMNNEFEGKAVLGFQVLTQNSHVVPCKNLVQDGRSPGRELNQSPSEHETGMVDIRPRHLVVAQEKQENVTKGEFLQISHRANPLGT